MKNIAIALLVTAFGCGIAAAQQPVQPTEQKEMKGEKKMTKKEKKPKMNKMMGTVEAVDAAGGKITVKDHKGMVMTMPVGAEAKIMKDGKAIPMTELMMGEKVHIMYEGEMAAPMVKEIKVMGKEGMKKEKMEKMEKKPEHKSGM